MTRPWLGMLAAAGLLAACGAREDERVYQKPTRMLVLGVMPEQNIFRQLERFQVLADYLGRRVDARVMLKVLPRYGAVIDEFRTGKLDGAFFGSLSYVLAHEKVGVTILARPEWANGASTYCGLVFVRKDSGLRTPRDLRGKRFAFVDKGTMAGYVLPLEMFQRAGISDLHAFLGEGYFAGTHEAAILDVLHGRADAGAAKSTVFVQVAAVEPRVLSELAVIDRSPDVPDNGLAVRAGLDPGLREALLGALLEMDRDPEGGHVLAEFGARRFIPTSHADYDVVYRYARAAHIDPAAYDPGP